MLLMKRLLPMQTLMSLGEDLQGLETCEDKLGGAVVGTMDGSFWVPCIITGAGTMAGCGQQAQGATRWGRYSQPQLSYNCSEIYGGSV